MAKIKFLKIPKELETKKKAIEAQVKDFLENIDTLEKDTIHIFIDKRTNSFYCECHISASDLTDFGTIDVPLDPDNQPDYRANRSVQDQHSAFQIMLNDALEKRSFSNIVCEYNTSYQAEKPIKVIGGQHRFLAIENALESGVDEYHGIKIYFKLEKAQRLDVQLISNTNISVSTDLLDRMFETAKGPDLRDWAQKVGLLQEGEDFSDKKQRGSQISVRGARTFIINFYKGKAINDKNFSTTESTPYLAKTGAIDEEWEKTRSDTSIWENKDLEKAAKAFVELDRKQRENFKGGGKKAQSIEYAEKAISYSVLSAWAFVAGVLASNKVRQNKHYNLSESAGSSDPLKANLLATAKHKSDPESYRGLGTRTDTKDRGRLAEVFYLQAEKGDGLSKPLIDLAIKKYHAKLSQLDVAEAEKKL